MNNEWSYDSAEDAEEDNLEATRRGFGKLTVGLGISSLIGTAGLGLGIYNLANDEDEKKDSGQDKGGSGTSDGPGDNEKPEPNTEAEPNTDIDSEVEFGSITEENYLEEDFRSRDRFETRLDEEYGEFLDEMRVFESEGRYFLDIKSGDTEYGALMLDGDYEDNHNIIGFDQPFVEDLHELSGNDVDEFVKFLEYAESRAD